MDFKTQLRQNTDEVSYGELLSLTQTKHTNIYRSNVTI